MRELPRQLTAVELAELFEGRTALVERLAEVDDPLTNAGEVIGGLSEEEKLQALAAHPAIGQRAGPLAAQRRGAGSTAPTPTSWRSSSS